ncbi:MAG: hypothetical protein BRC43_15245 [Cyanobacteria bacterium QS_3_48_167]|nr:MAG: hypothetical protein BRC43_15245 [Cyanobacteria bacterium QS_3_48_167]
MLYLAEVKRQSKGFIGGAKTKLKLLACQRNDQSWTAVSSEEMLPTEEASHLGEGALVTVHLGANRQIQGKPEQAGAKVVGLLQSFSSLLEKSKTQQAEVEQWKQSLSYQAQELSRREMEMEANLEQFEQMAEEKEQIEQQRQQVNSSQEELQKLKQGLEDERTEIEGAWEHLRTEQQRLAEKQSSVLDEAQTNEIQELISRLESAATPTESLTEQLNLALEVMNRQQANLDHHRQQLEQQRADAQQKSAEADQQGKELQQLRQAFQEAQVSLEEAKRALQSQEHTLARKRDSANLLALQLQTQEQLRESLSDLVSGSCPSQQVDVEKLENMLLGELQETVENLQRDWKKLLPFVNDQEEELASQRQSVEELQEKLQVVSDQERPSVEKELAEEQDRYRFLEQTLVGQRRSIQERKEVLNQHLRVLRRRQGFVELEMETSAIDLESILAQSEAQQNQTKEELQKLENQIGEVKLSVEQSQAQVQQQADEQATRQNQLRELEESWQQTQASALQLGSRVSVYEKNLQQWQEHCEEVRQKLEAVAQQMNRITESGNHQLQILTQLQQAVSSLKGSPEMAG